MERQLNAITVWNASYDARRGAPGARRGAALTARPGPGPCGPALPRPARPREAWIDVVLHGLHGLHGPERHGRLGRSSRMTSRHNRIPKQGAVGALFKK